MMVPAKRGMRAGLWCGWMMTLAALAGCGGGSSSTSSSPTQAAAPAFSPAGGTYSTTQTVTLSDASAGATIYYTLDGSTPTVASIAYSAPLSVAKTTIINAVAGGSGFDLSPESTATYTINLASAATPTFSPAPGTYTGTQSVTLTDATAGATLYYTLDGSTPTTASAVYAVPIAVSNPGATTISALAVAPGFNPSAVATGVYTILLGQTAAPTFSVAAGTYTADQTVTLADATPGAVIYYTLDGSAPTTSSTVYSSVITVAKSETVNAIAVAPNYSASTVASAAYVLDLPAASPTFTPAAGTYTSAQSVTLADTTPNATIYYTLDGSTPTAASTVYAAAIPLKATTTINAIATATGYTTSPVATAVYTLNIPPLATPTISPAGGSFSASQAITLADADPNATLYYTTSGDTPTTSSMVYSAPFTLSAPGTTTLSVIAVDANSGAANSAVATAAFTLPAGPAPAYAFSSVAIVGGGFVDGLYFHPRQQGLMYARTDVGGAYRWNNVTGGDTQWVPLTDFVGSFDSGFNLGIESLGLDPNDPTRVYLAVGEYTESFGTDGYILSSSDMGDTFTATALPFRNGSNDNGRFAGERLSVDPGNSRHIYFGTRVNGLYESTDQAASFHAVTAFPVTGATGTTVDPGVGVIFENFLTTSGPMNGNTKTVYFGVSDPTTSLYVSNDGGQTFAVVAGIPSQLTGYYLNSGVFDPANRYLYLSYGKETGCTTGCSSAGPQGVNAGQIWRYTLPTSSVPAGAWTNITPPTTGNGGYGYSSVTVDAEKPDTVMTTTLNKYYPPPYDDVFRSLDDGMTWVNYGTNIQRNDALSPWLNFGQATPDGGNWLNHPVIDPFNSDHVMYGDGQTIWQTMDATAVDGQATSTTKVTAGNATQWTVGAPGVEEAVVNGLISPSSGPANLLSVMYDLGGFTHVSLTQSQKADENPQLTNGWGIDYAGQAPLNISRVGDNTSAQGSGTAVQFEGFSSDGGITWTPSASLPVNSAGKAATEGDGTVAVAADGSNLVWQVKDVGFPANYSTDHGATWHVAAGVPAQVANNPITVLADKVNPKKFYLFDYNAGNAEIYLSTDGGMTFTLESTLTSSYDIALFASPLAEGDLWATSYNGINRSTNSGASFSSVLGAPNVAYTLGFGMPAPGATVPALYMIGQLAGDTACTSRNSATDGFTNSTECIYRSLDGGKSWVHINDYEHQYSNANVIVGDPRVFGRFYLGTPGRGILQGNSPD